MATTIRDLLTSNGLDTERLKTVKWGQSVESNSIGIYIISTCRQTNQNSNLYDQAPIDESTLRFWLSKVPAFQLDKVSNPTVKELKNRLSKFWFPDENIVYIGQTESSGGLRSRVNQYYKTELGERKPHAGGQWLKTLRILNQLFVHYIPDSTPTATEEKLLHAFANQVSDNTNKTLFDQLLPIPFANLELERGNRKRHGISKSKLGK